MALIFHRLVQKDVRAVLRYYEEEGGVSLADRSFLELDRLVAEVAREPRRFHPAVHGLRRVNMPFLITCFFEKFPRVFAS